MPSVLLAAGEWKSKAVIAYLDESAIDAARLAEVLADDSAEEE